MGYIPPCAITCLADIHGDGRRGGLVAFGLRLLPAARAGRRRSASARPGGCLFGWVLWLLCIFRPACPPPPAAGAGHAAGNNYSQAPARRPWPPAGGAARGAALACRAFFGLAPSSPAPPAPGPLRAHTARRTGMHRAPPPAAAAPHPGGEAARAPGCSLPRPSAGRGAAPQRSPAGRKCANAHRRRPLLRRRCR